MPESDRITALLEALADGTPVDWAALEATATGNDELAELRQLRRLGVAVARQRRAPARGATWSHLELIEKIGSGAFGEVYRAHDPRLARDVALKLLYEPMFADGPRASAVIEEGRLLARVRHPNVVTVYGAECRDGQVGIWTEFIDGQTLQALAAAQGPLPAAEVTAIGLDLCRALAAVHDAGLLHRDLKAQNVMREAGGRIVLMDFGTGRDLEPSPGQRTDVSGTPLYLAPELFRGGQASVASDIYALGVLMFFLATGRYPVSGATLKDVQAAHRDRRAGVAALLPGLPDGLRAALETALAGDPARRHATARAFERALLPLPDSPATAAPARPARRGRAKPSPSPWRNGLIAAGLVGIVAIAWTAWNFSRNGTGRVSGSGDRVATRQVWTGPDVRIEGSVSPDGRFLSAVGADGGLMLRDIEAGKDRQLTHGDADLVAESVISRDGGTVAYAWRDETTHRVELRTVTTEPGTPMPQTLINDASLLAIVPYDWSPDGQSIAVTMELQDRTLHLATVSVRDHTPHELKPIDWRGTTRMAFSPDGRFLAYDLPTGDSPDRDVYVMDVKVKEENAAIVRAGNDTFVGWTQGGPSLVFLSDRSGAIGVWTAPFVEHGLAGQAALVKPDLGSRTFTIGLTPSGMLVYGVQASTQNIFTAEVNFETGNLVGEPTQVSESFWLRNMNPDWSSDDKHLVFKSDRPRNVSVLSILTLDGSAPVREVRPDLSEFQRPRWHGDDSIAVQGTDWTGRQGIYRIDSSSGEATPVVVIGPDVTCTQASWLPDGRVVYRRESHRQFEIFIRDQSGDTPLVQPTRQGRIDRVSVSPNGTHLAWIENDGAASIVHVRPISGEPSDQVAWAVPPQRISDLLEWTPDGGRLVYGEGSQPSDYVVISVPVTGGTPVTVEGLRPKPGTNTLRINKDGRRVVYSAGDIKLEVWTLTNFLPIARKP